MGAARLQAGRAMERCRSSASLDKLPPMPPKMLRPLPSNPQVSPGLSLLRQVTRLASQHIVAHLLMPHTASPLVPSVWSCPPDRFQQSSCPLKPGAPDLQPVSLLTSFRPTQLTAINFHPFQPLHEANLPILQRSHLSSSVSSPLGLLCDITTPQTSGQSSPLHHMA